MPDYEALFLFPRPSFDSFPEHLQDLPRGAVPDVLLVVDAPRPDEGGVEAVQVVGRHEHDPGRRGEGQRGGELKKE